MGWLEVYTYRFAEGVPICTNNQLFISLLLLNFTFTINSSTDVKLISYDYPNQTIPGPEVIKLFSCSTQLSMKFKALIIAEITKIG